MQVKNNVIKNQTSFKNNDIKKIIIIINVRAVNIVVVKI